MDEAGNERLPDESTVITEEEEEITKREIGASGRTRYQVVPSRVEFTRSSASDGSGEGCEFTTEEKTSDEGRGL